MSVDVAWSAPCKDKRCYDYEDLANASDFLFVMGYDVRSQIFDLNDCIASANSPIASLQAGLTNYTQLFHISPWKLVLGGKYTMYFLDTYVCYFPIEVPWYRYDYRCMSLDANMTCVSCLQKLFDRYSGCRYLENRAKTCGWSSMHGNGG